MSYESGFFGYNGDVKGEIESTKLMPVQFPNKAFYENGQGKQHLLLQFHKTVIGHLVRKQVFQMFADILFIIMLEAAETTRMKQNKNNHNLSTIHAVRLLTMPSLFASIMYCSYCNENTLQKSSAIQ